MLLEVRAGDTHDARGRKSDTTLLSPRAHGRDHQRSCSAVACAVFNCHDPAVRDRVVDHGRVRRQHPNVVETYDLGTVTTHGGTIAFLVDLTTRDTLRLDTATRTTDRPAAHIQFAPLSDLNGWID